MKKLILRKLSGKSIYPNLLAIFILCSLGVIIYSNTFHSPFQLDDSIFITGITTKALSTISGIWHYWAGRFISFLTFAISYKINGLDVFGYHLVNLIIHLGVSSLVFWLTLLLFSTPKTKDEPISKHALPIALFAGLIFLSHPVQTESVTYIFQRASCLAGLFYILSICLYLKARLLQQENKSWANSYIFCWLFAILAMFTKENTLTLPVTILLSEFFFFKKRRYRYTIPFLILLPIIPILLFLSKSVISRDFENLILPTTYNELYYFLTQFRVMITYIRLLFIPVNQNLDYDYPLIKTFFDPGALASILALVIIIITAVKLFKRHRLISFSIFWFFITMLPESSLVHVKGDFIFEHWLYLPMAGYSLFLVNTAYELLGKKNFKAMLVLLLVIVSCYSALTYARNSIWKDEFTLWNDAALKSPHKARPYNNRGNAYIAKGQYDLAISDYNQVLKINPNYYEAYNNRGVAYQKKGNLDQAISDFNEALEINPNQSKAYHNRGNAYSAKGQYDQAISDYNQAIKINPKYAEAYSNRGNAYIDKGQYDLAISDYSKAIEINPRYAEAYYNRGNAYITKGKYDLAFSDYSQAIKINPNYAEVYNNRGTAYAAKGQYDLAISDFNQALEINPDQPKAYNNRAVAYFLKHEYEQAWEDIHKAESLGEMINPNFLEDLKRASGREK